MELDSDYYISSKFYPILYSDKFNLFFRHNKVLIDSNDVVIIKEESSKIIIKKIDLQTNKICMMKNNNNIIYDSNSIFPIENQSRLIFEDILFLDSIES